MTGFFAYSAIFVSLLSLKSGQLPNLENYIIYQRVFYLTGYGMLPIPAFPDFWSLYAAMLVVVLIWVSIAIATKDKDTQTFELLGYLLVLAICLSLYFSGRSHVIVLKLVSWPACIFYFFFADRAIRVLNSDFQSLTFKKSGSVVVSIRALAVCLTLPFCIMTLVQSQPIWFNVSIGNGKVTNVMRDAEFIAARTREGEPVGIIGFHQATLYAKSKTIPGLSGPSVAETLRVADLVNLHEEIVTKGPDKLFIHSQLSDAGTKNRLGANIEIDFDKIRSKYRLVENGPENRILFFKRMPKQK